MSIPWITLTPRLYSGIEYVNLMEPTKFVLLVQRLHTALEEEDEEKTAQPPFAQEELRKLEKGLGLNAAQVEAVVDSLSHVLRVASKLLMKPTVLQEELVERLRLQADKAEAFVRLWTEHAKRDFGELQNRKQLVDVKWELNLEAACDRDLKKVLPLGLVQLEVKGVEPATQLLSVQMGEEQLLRLYNDLERIQAQLDGTMSG